MSSANDNSKPALLRWMAKAQSLPVPVILLVLFLLPIVGFGLALVLPSQSLPVLKESEWQAAKTLWESKKPASYDLNIEFTALGLNDPLITIYQVECRDGKVTKLVSNGQEVNTPSQLETWSVDRMLKDIGEDIERRKSGTFNTTEGVVVMLHATFDEQLGYPLTYTRSARGNPENYSYKCLLTPR